jgi:hypothetical protein
MIVKKLYKKFKFRDWNKERKVFESVITIDYLGWFLFGIIPIYLVQLNISEEFNYIEGEKAKVFDHKVYRDYGHLMTK